MRAIADRELAAYRDGRDTYADTISNSQMEPVMVAAQKALKPAERQISYKTQDRVDTTEGLIRDADQTSLAALVLAIGVAAMIAIWLMRSINGPVRALEKGMRAVADGDLEHRLDLSPHRRMNSAGSRRASGR